MANINDNKLNAKMTAVDEATVRTAAETIFNTMQNYSSPITDEERASLPTLKVDNLVFAHLALDQAEQLGNLLPPVIQNVVAQLRNDFELFTTLDTLENTLVNQIAAQFSDGKRVVGYESMTAANTIYRIIEALHISGVAQASPAYQVLKERYTRNGAGAPVIPTP